MVRFQSWLGDLELDYRNMSPVKYDLLRLHDSFGSRVSLKRIVVARKSL